MNKEQSYINFLFCIDTPAATFNGSVTDTIEGWLLCSEKIISVSIHDKHLNGLDFQCRKARPDVASAFPGFPDNEACGFKITGNNAQILLNRDIVLSVETASFEGKKNPILLHIGGTRSEIGQYTYGQNQKEDTKKWLRAEKKYMQALALQPLITLRLDIVNKCNLKCIMCHYKEDEINSQPLKLMSADRLNYLLKDIAPYTKHIMLSCGFEPLMSKYFGDIVSMIRGNYPHMEIGMCTNGMLMNSKNRKLIIEKNITHVIFSLDGVKKQTVEKIRVGASFERIISNIMALKEAKIKQNKTFPLMFMDFVLMSSNIHEAPAFVELCSKLGMELIDFRHLVGNIFFSDHEEMLSHHKEKYNLYRQRIIEESVKHHIKIRLPDAYPDAMAENPDDDPEAGLSDFYQLRADVQIDEICESADIILMHSEHTDFLNETSCPRPFNEIMITEQEKVFPCAYYSRSMGSLTGNNTLYSVFFDEAFRKVRKRKVLSQNDFHCMHCPIKNKLLPTETIK